MTLKIHPAKQVRKKDDVLHYLLYTFFFQVHYNQVDNSVSLFLLFLPKDPDLVRSSFTFINDLPEIVAWFDQVIKAY